MPFESRRSPLVISPDTRETLSALRRSRSEPTARVQRASILLAYADGETVSAIARQMRTNRPKVERCINRALQIGALPSLSDLPGRGKTATISPEAKAWVLALACQKPKELGYAQETWTTSLLASHVRKHCIAAGHPSLADLARGTVSKILTKGEVRPHKITYYLERRDPDFESKMAQVLFVYREVAVLRQAAEDVSPFVAVLSFDEKPGIQAIGTTAPDLPPVPGTHPSISRDHEYIRHGTLSLMAGIDLLSGYVHAHVVERHRSREFIAFLHSVHEHYPSTTLIRIVLDNHSAHISKETRAYLATVPNRFEFIFTPKHGSWLNLIETFFSKMTRSLLRGIRVSSKAELRERIEKYLAEVNEEPVVFRWTYKLDELPVA